MVGPPTSQNIFFHSVIKYPLSAAVHFNDNSTYDPEDPDRDRLHKVKPLLDMLYNRFRTVYRPEKMSASTNH